jgi:hypothetical protein
MEILVGSNPPVKHKVFWGGELVDATSNPTVTIYDITEDPAISPLINPGTILSVLTSIKSDYDPGTYYVLVPLDYANRPRELKLVWNYSVNGTAIQKQHDLYVVTPYTDIAQAIDVLGVSSDPSDPKYKTYYELCEAERYARKIIETYTGQQFYLYDDVHTIYGAGTEVLPLPYRLSELHELYQNDVLLIDTINNVYNSVYDIIVSESGFGIRVDRSNLLDNTVYAANGMVPPSINDTSFGVFAKDSVYRVAGRYGWDHVPDEVDVACIELMKDYFGKDNVWRNKYVKNIQMFDWQFEYASSAYSGTGNAYVDQILLPYVINQMVVI